MEQSTCDQRSQPDCALDGHHRRQLIMAPDLTRRSRLHTSAYILLGDLAGSPFQANQAILTGGGGGQVLHHNITSMRKSNWPWWIRTTINGSKVRCPAIGRRASQGEFTRGLGLATRDSLGANSWSKQLADGGFSPMMAGIPAPRSENSLYPPSPAQSE